ncbi:autotransporter outer membrane beta-barrel domain-containing protein [Flavisphingomonas formosensis]|uniref:autotransporter outer membrane beta-barrel domain-containing protein n=1 Tax=Flavisphingomonas formosensis TaxID=861534 RepID=UPI0012FC137E|nr:autotransporter outer membrane beta-barrel domain-containing protein [Sphingomonas formosensis]
MRSLLATTCLTPLVLAAAAHAETSISTAITTPVLTSTVKSGTPDDVRITSAGSVKPAAGVAVTIDSANKVTNEGTIQITDSSNATGILANAGTSGGITNAAGGKIQIDETYTPTDSDNDGDLDGPFATGSNRFGIRTAGAYSGAIINSGTITIEGNDSAGIKLGGALTGSLTTDGTIGVVGDRSVGVSTGAVNGSVRLAGTITAQGKDASAAVIGGPVSGALVVQGSLASTGYRNTTPPGDTSKLDADDLLQGGPTLLVSGDVNGGIVFAVPPKDADPNNNDEDGDGIDDSKEGSATVTSYGSAPAVQIGATDHAVAIGPVAGTSTGFGIVIDGSIAGNGVYSGVNGNGLVVGGLGGAVTVAGGIGINGSVTATANGASATAIRIGSGATVPEIRVAGTVSAAGGGTTASVSTGIQIDSGANVSTIRNSGTIKATASAADGTAVAIRDVSGSVSLIENGGAISASGAASDSARNIAIDLSANGSGVTVKQIAVADGVAAPSISGDILFGSGNDLLDIADGSVSGTTRFNGGNNALSLSGDAAYTGNTVFGAGNDTMTLGGTATYTGSADFGGGADSLTLGGSSIFSGTLANSGGLAVTVSGGTLRLTSTGTTALGSLAVSNGSTLGIAIGGTGANTQIQVAGNASFAEGSKLAVRINSITQSEGHHVFLTAGSVNGGSNLSLSSALPFLYKGTVDSSTAGQVAVDISRKTAGELGLNRSQAAAYNAVYAALSKDAQVGGAFLNIADGDSFRKTLRQMLPDHAGGAFESVTQGSRAVGRILADPNAPFSNQGKWGFWLQQVAWGTAKSLGDTASYDVSGWGISGGAEIITGVGNFGVSLAYLYGKDADGGTANKVDAQNYEVSGYWRANWGRLNAWARGGWGHVRFKGTREFSGSTGSQDVERTAKGHWNGNLVSASGGVSYRVIDGHFSLRPIASVDYYRLSEGKYAEQGGGDAFNLFVAKRKSDELAVSGSVAAGLNFGGQDVDSGWFRIELEGGRRQLVGGDLGATTAHFAGGEDFTLDPEKRKSGWIGRLRAQGGNGSFRVGGEFGAEQQQGHAALSLRVGLQVQM